MSWLLVVEILDTKPLRNAVPCNGCMHQKGSQICSTAKPSLGNTSSKGVNLAEFTLSELPSPRGSALQARTSELAPGRLSSAGITALALIKHFVAIGAHACDSCRLLKSVDLCNTNVEEIPEFTFVHCTSLREVLLPTTLHTIRVKAFVNCAALVELAIPPSLRYIGSRAFLDCTAFKTLAKMPGHKWREVYAEENTFAIFPAMRRPPWLHMILDMGYTPGLG